MMKQSAFPKRRGSNASEDDFFDIPDEPVLSVFKRQLRRKRLWVIILIVFLLFKWLRRDSPPSPRPSAIQYNNVDWSRYAYTQYATSETYLCNSIMVFDALHRLGSRAERVLFYPEEWDLLMEGDYARTSELLRLAMSKYKVQLMPVRIEGIKGENPETSTASWDTSTAKLNAFAMVQYDRVIHLDSDVILLQEMDELFFLPSAIIAMPRAYWLLPQQRSLSSLLAVIQPSHREYKDMLGAIEATQNGQIEVNLTATRYDMEILNDRYGDQALVLPHRQYGLVSGEFRAKRHTRYLGNDHEDWNADRVLAEAKFVHFSDWPGPKPWVTWKQDQLALLQPACDINPGTEKESGCRNREVWKNLYNEFRRKRKDICQLLSFPPT
ncbi:Glucose N-acetyltransferase 1 [Penicillium capsulatum]|uniref:Glucose N-acetyltransferase 1 n=1 Tax=Penicillium capsulatum TaxID=69766 RepID=A0A9W9IPF4_9EURO|nr:Glucose N-acetyltransferase 1 [Penicillium capsulatum]KAJ6122787.1 Glucose N-acetyltransferase 1 [Penicillium capsulatum]